MSTTTPLDSRFALKPLKFLAPLRGDKVDAVPVDGEYLGLEQLESWTGRLSDVPLEQMPEGGANVFRAGDILFGKLRPYLAKGWVADRAGYCSTESLVLSPFAADPRFVRYCLLSQQVVSAIDGSTYGSKMPRADWNFIGSVKFPAPPRAAQERIANFLDEKTARIDALIAEKKRLARSLDEYQTSVVGTEMEAALTRGSRQLRFGIRLLSQGWSPTAGNSPAAQDEWGVLKLSAIKSGEFYPEENKVLDEDMQVPVDLRVRAGDVLITRANTPDLVGAAALVTLDDHRLITSDLVYTVRVDERKLDARFLVLFVNSPVGRAQIEADARGSSQSMVKISQEHVRSLRVPSLPVPEQRAISVRLLEVIQKTRHLEEHVEKHISGLLAYRVSLITAAVTGQLPI